MKATLFTALRGACPKFGNASLFGGFLALVEQCTSCAYPWREADTGDGPAVFVILIVGGIVGALALITEMHFAPPVWVHMVLWLPLTMILSAGLLRFSKALLVGILYSTKINDADL
jgi:uncharacterized protein (DUF983 family)